MKEFINKIHCGNNMEIMKKIPDNSIDTIITDPPYGLSFMGKKWDYDVPGIETWKECLRVLKPGGTALIFAGSRTQHRMAVNVEDAGFILKDCIMWLYGSGFPKATDISKQLMKIFDDKGTIIGYKHNEKDFRDLGKNTKEQHGLDKLGVGVSCKRQDIPITKPTSFEAKLWNGWKSQGLKPAYEPILVAMKTNDGTYANNVLKYGVSGLNIDGGRIPLNGEPNPTGSAKRIYVKNQYNPNAGYGNNKTTPDKGRFPANIILECICDEVITEPTETKEPEEVKGGIWNKSEGKPAGRTYKGGNQVHTNPDCPCAMLDKQSGTLKSGNNCKRTKEGNFVEHGRLGKAGDVQITYGDKGGASRFFYCAKASKSERNKGCDDIGGNKHCTVKPLKLMEYLCTLTKTPTGGIVLDPYAGSGTTGLACINTSRPYILIEREQEYVNIAKARLNQKEIV